MIHRFINSWRFAGRVRVSFRTRLWYAWTMARMGFGEEA
jgi:hypothetical protein